jgi:hypothetical protein
VTGQVDDHGVCVCVCVPSCVCACLPCAMLLRVCRRVRPKSIEARLRAATCLCKLGCLAAADRLLDKVRGSKCAFELMP